jgi:hypothetical protein
MGRTGVAPVPPGVAPGAEASVSGDSGCVFFVGRGSCRARDGGGCSAADALGLDAPAPGGTPGGTGGTPVLPGALVR